MAENLTDQAYNILLRKIITADYKPGARISEKQIEEDLSIGRTPVREALLRLRQEHLIDVVPQSGTYIAKIDLKTVLEARFVRISVEQKITEEAAQRKLTNLQKAQLNDIINKQKMSNQEKDFANFFKYDDQFHELFYQFTDHAVIWNWLKRMNIQFDRFRYLSLNLGKSSWNNLIKEHQAILQAVEAGNKKQAQKMVTRHLHLVIEEKNALVKKFPSYFENTDIAFQ